MYTHLITNTNVPYKITKDNLPPGSYRRWCNVDYCKFDEFDHTLKCYECLNVIDKYKPPKLLNRLLRIIREQLVLLMVFESRQ